MRTHVLGWAILGLAALAFPPWESAERFRAARGGHASTPSTDAMQGASVPAPSLPALPGAMPGSAPAAGAAGPARRTLAAAPELPGRSATKGNASRAVQEATPVAVREFAPGSPAHAQAIAAHIASAQVEDLVSPVARLYLAYFGRAPDYEGLDYYIGERDRGEPLDAIAEEFAGSEEFGARYGTLDNAAFVDRVLRNIFGFPGDAAQIAHWAGELDSGRMTRGQVMLMFSETPGYRAITANEVFVSMAYAEALGRAPDPADLARWVAFLDAGNPRRAVVESLLALRPRPPVRRVPRRD